MSTSCLSMVSSLKLSFGLAGRPCAGKHARMDVAKSWSMCRVSVVLLRLDSARLCSTRRWLRLDFKHRKWPSRGRVGRLCALVTLKRD